jgi:hypothetical protein
MTSWLRRLPLRAIAKLVVKAAAAVVCFFIGNDTAVRDLAHSVVREVVSEISALARTVLPTIITDNMVFS